MLWFFVVAVNRAAFDKGSNHYPSLESGVKVESVGGVAMWQPCWYEGYRSDGMDRGQRCQGFGGNGLPFTVPSISPLALFFFL